MKLERFTVVIFCDAEAWVATNVGANYASDLIDQIKAEEMDSELGIAFKDLIIDSEIAKLRKKLKELEELKSPTYRDTNVRGYDRE